MKVLGLRLNAKKSVLSPLQRTTYLGVVWDLTTMQARLSPARIESILTAVVRVRKGRSLTVKQFQQLLGLMAAVSNVILFGLLYMRPLQWWLRTKWFSPRENPFHTSRSRGPGAGSSSLPRNARDGCVPHRFMERSWTASLPTVCGVTAVSLGISLPGDAGCVSGSETLPPRPKRPPCAGPHRQHSGGQTPLTESSLNSWASQLGSRHPAEAWGMDASPRGGEADLESVCQGQVDLFANGTDVVEASSVRLSPIALLPGVLERVRPEGAHLIASGLSTEVVETILQSRAPSSRKLYADLSLHGVETASRTQLTAQLDRFSTWLAHSTLKVYMAAISAYHAPLGGSSVGRNPLITRFLHGALRPRPLARCSFAKCGRDAIS
ncbi:Protein P [Labeo rohita]|uniref:Protein P n=1 Tax=Labeo rohita TaxID=84645 RepID=A0ABQ8L2B1_LABRO|nr:Protein P [Labeo rohita]